MKSAEQWLAELMGKIESSRVHTCQGGKEFKGWYDVWKLNVPEMGIAVEAEMLDDMEEELLDVE